MSEPIVRAVPQPDRSFLGSHCSLCRHYDQKGGYRPVSATVQIEIEVTKNSTYLLALCDTHYRQFREAAQALPENPPYDPSKECRGECAGCQIPAADMPCKDAPDVPGGFIKA